MERNFLSSVNPVGRFELIGQKYQGKAFQWTEMESDEKLSDRTWNKMQGQ